MPEILQQITPEELQARHEQLKAIKEELIADTSAPLYVYRKKNGYHPVIGEGNHAAKIMFVGEAPGENEAKQGRPFCGASGRFLDVMLEHIQLARADVYITNTVKDRPPENRDPLPAEIEYYTKYLDRQIQILRPSCVVTLGRFSMGYLMPKLGLASELKPISQIHGNVFAGELEGQKISLVTLYHPAVALYTGSMRAKLLSDVEILKTFLS